MRVLLVVLLRFIVSPEVKNLEHPLSLVSQNGKNSFCSAK